MTEYSTRVASYSASASYGSRAFRLDRLVTPGGDVASCCKAGSLSFESVPIMRLGPAIRDQSSYLAHAKRHNHGCSSLCQGHFYYHEFQDGEKFLFPPPRVLNVGEMDDDQVKSLGDRLMKSLDNGYLDAQVPQIISSMMRTKRGVLRSRVGCIRPHNSIRSIAVLCPSMELGYISIPTYMASRSKMVWINEDGLVVPRRFAPGDQTKSNSLSIRDGDVVLVGRNPTQGTNSILPVKVKISDKDHFAIEVNPSLCEPLHLDFDGDVVWVLVPCDAKSSEELLVDWKRVWGSARSQDSLFYVKDLSQEILDLHDTWMNTSHGGDLDLDDYQVVDDPYLCSTRSLTEIRQGLMPKDIMGAMQCNISTMRNYANKMLVRESDLDYYTRLREGCRSMFEGHYGLARPGTTINKMGYISSMINEEHVDDKHTTITWYDTNNMNKMRINELRVPMNIKRGTISAVAFRMLRSYHQCTMDIMKHKGALPTSSAYFSLFGGGSCSLSFAVDSVSGSFRVVMPREVIPPRHELVELSMSWIRRMIKPSWMSGDLVGTLPMLIKMVLMINKHDLVIMNKEEVVACACLLGFLAYVSSQDVDFDLCASSSISQITKNTGVGILTRLALEDFAFMRKFVMCCQQSNTIDPLADLALLL